MGYGLVTGLSGTGDRVTGSYGSRQTVQSVVNLLRRFDIEVPPEMLRTRNVASVLVTAEVSPYLRKGGRFDVRVSSLGDAQSLRGGVLWMTPLVAEAGETPVAGAQGALSTGATTTTRIALQAATSGRVPDGGVLEVDLPRPAAAIETHLLLREPDITTAVRIATLIDSALGGPGNATVVDPGSIALTPRDTSGGFASVLARIRELRVQPARAARLVIDARDGTIVAGGELTLGNAVVSHDGITVAIGDAAPGDTLTVRAGTHVPAGASVRDLATALRAVRASAAQTAAIFSALRDAGALVVEVVIR
jgi:flagellar P-ring protein precursor FlgI